MKKKLLVCIVVFFSVALMVPPSLCQADWTVMIYMDGDNNLEEYAIDDLNEMEVSGSTINVNIVVQLDRIIEYDSSNGDWDTTRRYYVTNDINGYDNNIVSTMIAELGEQNMGDPNTLINFVNWARTAYPATNYLLVLWDHGDGWKKQAHITQKGALTKIKKKEPIKGVCYDDTDNDHLTIPEIDTALTTITAGGTIPIDVIGFDACLMAMIEIGYEVSPYCDYMVASEESEPADGWDYLTTMFWLTTNPGSTPAQVASRIVTDYMTFYGFLGYETQSAVDLSQIPAVAAAVDTLAADLINTAGVYFFEIQDIRNQVEEYDDPDFVDLYHFAQLVQATIPDAQIQSDAVAVMNAITTAVIQEGHGVGNPDSHGISIYFPYGYCSYLSRYETDTHFALATLWDEFLGTYYSTIPPILHTVALIDDDDSGCGNLTPVEGYYMGVLDDLNILYDYYDASIHGAPSLSYLQAHAVVIWFTGSDFSTTLTPADENVLMQYLTWGGKLFLSSQDYIWDLKNDGRYPSTFLRNYLHTSDDGEDTGVNSLIGIDGNEVGDQMGPYSMCWVPPTWCTFADYGDWIEKDHASEYAFRNETGEYMAVTYSGGYEVVFFAFRFEGLRYDPTIPVDPVLDRLEVMQQILNFFGPLPMLGFLAESFSTNTFLVAGDTAYATDVLGSANIAFALGVGGALENPEGRTDVTLTAFEHDNGNLIPVGGPAVNPVADEFDIILGVSYDYQPGVSFEIFADGQSIYLDLLNYPLEDIAIVYLGVHNNRFILLVWGYGWQATYAASVFLGDTNNWQAYQGSHMIMVRWIDLDIDGLVDVNEVFVEASG
jgi:hypothetical protein